MNMQLGEREFYLGEAAVLPVIQTEPMLYEIYLHIDIVCVRKVTFRMQCVTITSYPI